MTPTAIADFMTSLFKKWPAEVRLLDPGAGVGSLTEAFSAAFLKEAPAHASLSISTYEIEPLLNGFLSELLRSIETAGKASGHPIKANQIERDFVREASFALSFGGPRFTHVILNPPYKKIGAASEYRKLLRQIGVETVNLYTAFLALGIALADQDGEIVAIVPRSFCNGSYFRPFRHWLFEQVALTNIHVFESRKKAFHEDDVLQENIIVRLVRGAAQGPVIVSSSNDQTFADYTERKLVFEDVVKPDDPERFIHIPTREVNGSQSLFAYTLAELGFGVATGPVVDFRVRDYWLQKPKKNSAPLLYTHHFSKGEFRWPFEHKKPNALRLADDTRKWLLPNGWYTITKRFSSKEEKRRLVAYVVDPNNLPGDWIGFENHLNVIHEGKHGLDASVARGIALFLNSTIVDERFRSFSGHTQVNATDLRNMRFPSKKLLVQFGKWAAKMKAPTQAPIDRYIESHHGA